MLDLDIHGEITEYSISETLSRFFGTPNSTSVNEYFAVERVVGNKITYLYLTIYTSPNNRGWWNGRNEKQLLSEMQSKSIVVFMFMNMFSKKKRRLYKKIKTDLQDIPNRNKTIDETIKHWERIVSNPKAYREYWGDITQKTAFYLKDGSFYKLFIVSPKYYPQIEKVCADFGVKLRRLQ